MPVPLLSHSLISEDDLVFRHPVTVSRGHGRAIRATVVSAVAVAAALSTAGTPTALAAASAHKPAWQSYVLGPSSPQVTPVNVETRGNVSHPNTLVRGGKETTLTTVAGGAPASILLDFGKDVGGTPYFDISKLSGSPTLSIVTSESRQFIRTPANTKTSAAAGAGATSVALQSRTNLEVGNAITFGTGAAAQTRTITAIGTSASTVSFSRALSAALPSGTAAVSAPGAPTADDSGGLSGFGGTATLKPTAAGHLTAPFRGGFRFALITLTSPGSVSLSGAGVNFQALRATPSDYQGWFLSSSKELNQMWYSGAYTVQLDVSANGLNGLPGPLIFDGAKRDRAVWTGDLIVQDATLLNSLGSAAAPEVKSSLNLVLSKQRADGALPGSPDFGAVRNPLFYSNNYSGYGVRAVLDYYRYTEDNAYITSVLPALEKELAYNATFVDANGLVVSNDRDYWQATQNGEVTKYSLDYYILLREMAWLETQVGTPQKAADYNAKADALKTAINARLWNPTLGAYGQSNLSPNTMVEDANALALQYGIVPTDKVASVQAALKTLWTPNGALLGTGLADPTGHTIEPYGNGMETAGRFASGDTAGALDLMQRTWGQMVDPDNPLYTGAFWEFLTPAGTVNRSSASLAHGWASSPTTQLTQQVLGVTPVDPGYATWNIQPHPGNLKWSQGVVPTAHGTIQVDWTSKPGKKSHFELNADAPADTSGTVAVPASSANVVVTVDGKVVWNRGTSLALGAQLSDGYIHLALTGGSHHITVTQG